MTPPNRAPTINRDDVFIWLWLAWCVFLWGLVIRGYLIVIDGAARAMHHRLVRLSVNLTFAFSPRVVDHRRAAIVHHLTQRWLSKRFDRWSPHPTAALQMALSESLWPTERTTARGP
jgi:hypothetical protein